MSEKKVNQEAKRLFARLLATEDIMVCHDSSAKTATFDTSKRILTLPVLENMDDDIYDLFVGHEVGHALFTIVSSDDEMLEILNRVCKDNKTLAKIALNIVEDARIERMMRNKYPGISKNFIRGYQKLHAGGFFGDNISKNFKELHILDRINLYYKLDNYGICNFSMNDDEITFIRDIDEAKTFDDVIEICIRLCKFILDKNDKNTPAENNESVVLIKSEASNGDQDVDDSSQDDMMENPEENDNNPDSSILGSNGATVNYGDKSLVTNSLEDSMQKYIESIKTTEDKSVYYYYNIVPTPNLSRIIIPWKDVHSLITDHYNSVEKHTIRYCPSPVSSESVVYDIDEEYKKFLDSTKTAVSSMVLSFKRKQQAAISRRISISKSGRLNMDIIHTYKYNDDLFLRSCFVPKGKNHGMIMYIDWSGSMAPNIKQTVEQTMNLALFCKAVNIPFRVLAFTDVRFSRSEQEENSNDSFWNELPHGNNPYSSDVHVDNRGIPYMRVSNFHLLELITSEMNSLQFNNAMKNLMFISDCVGGKHLSCSYPRCLSLSGTPLNECVIAGISIAKEFRAKYNIQILNTVFLTDGEAGGNCVCYKDSRHFYDRRNARLILIADGIPHDCKNDIYGVNLELLEIYRNHTGSRNIGFFLCSAYTARTRIANYYATNKNHENRKNTTDDAIRQFNRDGYSTIQCNGYDIYYLMQSNHAALSLDDVFGKIEENSNKRSIISSFIKSANLRSKSRILLNNFAEIVAQDL